MGLLSPSPLPVQDFVELMSSCRLVPHLLDRTLLPQPTSLEQGGVAQAVVITKETHCDQIHHSPQPAPSRSGAHECGHWCSQSPSFGACSRWDPHSLGWPFLSVGVELGWYS